MRRLRRILGLAAVVPLFLVAVGGASAVEVPNLKMVLDFAAQHIGTSSDDLSIVAQAAGKYPQSWSPLISTSSRSSSPKSSRRRSTPRYGMRIGAAEISPT